MRPDERDRLRQHFHYRCGYCGVRERDVGSELTVDHFQPRSRGGLHECENWVYCCHACNEFKGDFWEPDAAQHILHPLRDLATLHLVEEDDGTLRALSEAGEFHIKKLRLNRVQLVAYRRERRLLENARQRQARLVKHLQELEEHVQKIITELDLLRRDD